VPGDQTRIDALLGPRRRGGYRTLVVTVDVPVAGQSIQQHARGIFDAAASLVAPGYDGLSHPRWLLGTFVRTLLRHACRTSKIRSPNAALR